MKHFRWIFAVSAAAMLISAAPTAQPQERARPWKFAVMADTQWLAVDDGYNPGTVPVAIIRQLNRQFIARHVKFVVQVGDLVDQTGSTLQSVRNSEGVHAAFVQELYNAGIGFFPLRGNHDSNNLAGYEFKSLYPQTQNGSMNATPSYVADGTSVVNPDQATQPFPSVGGHRFVMGAHFGTPDPTTSGGFNWTGLSYSFDYENARFVLLDQFTPLQADPTSTLSKNPWPSAIDVQQPWIDTVLAGRHKGTHAFVFSHKGLIDENHVDTLFGTDPSQDAAGQNAFITSLHNNGVRYYMQGHDHIHDRSLVSVTTGTPTDGLSATVQNLLLASDSSKFYTPGSPANDVKYDVAKFGHVRQAQIAQELHTIGYYIVTVDGPRVTVDYYSAPVPNVAPDGCGTNPNCEWLISTTPALKFVKAETFGYSLNGREFLVEQGGSYTAVQDEFEGTTAQILGGSNGSTAEDFDGRSFVKTVDTGWTDADGDHLESDVLTLWGMADLYSHQTDVYTLSMSYDGVRGRSHQDADGLGLVTKNRHGEWVNAVDRNAGGTKHFVKGPWKSSYPLGTYGVDASTHTVWAVINHNGDFAVARDIQPEQEHRR